MRSSQATHRLKLEAAIHLFIGGFTVLLSMSKSSTKSQVITCKAVVCWGAREPLKVEAIQVDPPKASEVRIKNVYASVCHTDILCINGFPQPDYPRVLGHEGVGVVESVGEEVKELKEGNTVIPTYLGECKECENCRSEVTNLCLKYQLPVNGLMMDGSSRMSIRGQKLYHTFSCATWSEYTVVDVNYVVKVDENIPLSHASFLSCGFSTGFGASWKDFSVETGSTVAVLGLGAVGLGAVNGAKLRGAAKIIGIDKNPWKKQKGEAFGITDFINPSEKPEKSISELVKEKTTDGMGVDYSFECSGVISLVSQLIAATKMGKGKTMAIGVGNKESMDVHVMTLLGGRTFKGTLAGGLKIKSDFPILFHKCKNKEFELDELLTHEVSLEEINKIFELLKRPDCLKILIKI